MKIKKHVLKCRQKEEVLNHENVRAKSGFLLYDNPNDPSANAKAPSQPPSLIDAPQAKNKHAGCRARVSKFKPGKPQNTAYRACFLNAGELSW